MPVAFRLLLPGPDGSATGGDLDVSAAPAGGVRYVDARRGDDLNDGTTAAKAKRYLSAIPDTIAAGATVYVRTGRTYHAPVAAQKSIAFSGASGNTAKLRFWGNAGDAPAVLGGDQPLAGWAAVTTGFNNAWLIANGEQIALPSWATPWHTHYKGHDMFTPAFWSPVSPADLSQVCRQHFIGTYVNGECMFTSALRQSGAAGTGLNGSQFGVARDMTVANTETAPGSGLYDNVTFSSAGSYFDAGENRWTGLITTVYYRHSAIAAHYGSNSPVGAIVMMRRNPSNLADSGIITAYDQARSEITVTMRQQSPNTYGEPIIPQNEWWIIGHPFDIRQPGQYGWLWNGGAPIGYRAKGDWMRGPETIAFSQVVLGLSGTYADIAGNHLVGRVAGQGTSGATPADVLFTPAQNTQPCAISYGTFTDALHDGLATGQMWDRNYSSALLNGASPDIQRLAMTNFRCTQQWTMGFMRFSAVQSSFDRGFVWEQGRTGFYAGSNRLTITNVEMSHDRSFHGNGGACYEASYDNWFDKCFSTDRVLNFTAQGEDGSVQTVPRDLEWTRIFATTSRDISIAPGTGPQPGTWDVMRWDDSAQNSRLDRFFAPIAGRSSLYIGTTATSGYLARNRVNDNLVVSRSALAGLFVAPGGGTAQGTGGNLGVNPEIKDSFATSATLSGATSTRNTIAAESIAFNGCIGEEAWEAMSRTAANTTGAAGAHEAFQLGTDAVDWQVPAWSNTTPRPVGAPVDLRVSRNYFYRNHQAGLTLATVYRSRPLSVLSLPAGLADNASFILDRGALVPTVRLTGLSYTAIIRETTITGATRDTTLTFEGLR